MANNCLVTKLKGVVNNDLLPHLGYAQIYLHADTPSVLNNFNFSRLYGGVSGVPNIRISGDGYIVDVNDQNIGKTFDTTSINFITNSQNPNSNIKGIYVGSDAILEIKDNCADASIDTNSFDFRSLTAGYTSIDFDVFKKVYDTADFINTSWSIAHRIKGNIIPLMSKTRSIFLVTAVDDGSKIYGNLNDVNLRANSFISVVQINNAPNLKGNIENLMNEVAAKSETGSGIRATRVYITDCPLIKYKGESIGNGFDVTFNVDTDNKTWSEPA